MTTARAVSLSIALIAPRVPWRHAAAAAADGNSVLILWFSRHECDLWFRWCSNVCVNPSIETPCFLPRIQRQFLLFDGIWRAGAATMSGGLCYEDGDESWKFSAKIENFTFASYRLRHFRNKERINRKLAVLNYKNVNNWSSTLIYTFSSAKSSWNTKLQIVEKLICIFWKTFLLCHTIQTLRVYCKYF